jgi:hypothetical protein
MMGARNRGPAAIEGACLEADIVEAGGALDEPQHLLAEARAEIARHADN